MVNFENTKLYGLSNKKYLSELLHIDLDKFKNIEQYYNTSPFYKKTPNGKIRPLYNPQNDYKRVLQRLNSYLQQITPPDYIYGGVKKRSYIMNASVHKDTDYFLTMDLKDFFPSTSDEYVYKFFKNKLQMASDIAKICTLLTTEPSPKNTNSRRHLPQGYTTSPYLSFLSYFDMYNGINVLAKTENMNFSCYYDDFTFSSSKFISKSFKESVTTIIDEYGLQINHKKTRLSKKKEKGVKVTGAIIRTATLKAPNSLQKKMINTFEKLVFTYEKNPNSIKEIQILCNQVQGILTAIKSIEPERNFPYINSKVKEVRESLKRKRRR